MTRKAIETLEERTKRMLVIPAFVLLIGILMTCLYPLGMVEQVTTPLSYAKFASASFLLAGSSLLTGGFFGFLFGIPRTLQEQGSQEDTNRGKISYRVNTNLEQISDWLTKILVGVGLTQLTSVPSAARKLSAFLGDPFGEHGHVFVIIVLVYFLVCGFLLGYIATRLLFVTALAYADTAAMSALEDRLKSTAERIEKSISASEAKAEIDAKALFLLDKQLELSTDRNQDKNLQELKEILQELKETLLEASPSIKRQAFIRAQQIRKNSWSKEDDRDDIDKIIPILRILIEDESEYTSDKLYAELGYALKDKPIPNWQESEQNLTHAIRFRGDWKIEGSRIYEFNRAHCRIMLDQQFKKNEPATSNQRDAIVEDIAIAISRKKLRRSVIQNRVFQDWIRVNNVTKFELDKFSDDDTKQS